MEGKIIKISDSVGFIEYDLDKRISYTSDSSYNYQVGDIVSFELGVKKVLNSSTEFDIATNLILVRKRKELSGKFFRLSKVARQYNCGITKIIEILKTNGFEVESNPNSKIYEEQILILEDYFAQENAKIEEPKTIERGTVINSVVLEIIFPSMVIMQFFNDQKAVLTSNNLSWNKSRSEKIIRSLKKGDNFEVVVLENEPDKHPIVSKKHLLPRPSETSQWEDLEIGETLTGKIFEVLINDTIIELENGFFGLVRNKGVNDSPPNSIQEFTVLSKNQRNHYLDLSFVKKESLDKNQKNPNKANVSIGSNFSAHETELESLSSFQNSIYMAVCDQEQEDFIAECFIDNPHLFSSTISIGAPLFIQFGFNLPAWESDFRNKLLPYLSKIIEQYDDKSALEYLSNQKYWIRVNRFEKDGEEKINWVLFNEEFHFAGFVSEEDYRFIILSLSIERSRKDKSRQKAKSLANGTFQYESEIQFLAPDHGSIDFSNQNEVFKAIDNKTRAFDIILSLKKETGTLLLEEGQSLQIFDRFLEYQEYKLKSENFEKGIWIHSKLNRKISSIGNVSIQLDQKIDELCGENDQSSIVTIKTLEPSAKEDKDEEHVYFSDAYLELNDFGTQLHFDESIDVEKLEKGFFVEPKTSVKQYQVQKEVIQDFFSKKIKLEHIEALLVKPEKIKEPEVKSVDFYNEMLTHTESTNPNNNQVASVKKSVGNKNIFLVQGPPGTGKTTVIAEIVKQLCDKGERILVTSQTHIAVDNVLEKLSEEKHLSLLRLGNIQRVKPELRIFHKDKLEEIFEDYFVDAITLNIKLANEYKLHSYDHQELIKLAEDLQDYPESIKLELFKYNLNFIQSLISLSNDQVDSLCQTLDHWKQNISTEISTIVKPLIYNSLDIVFATCIGVRTDKDLSEYKIKFDTVIIDEAGKANLSESIAAMSVAKKVILVGDQMQLPPYIDGSLLDPEVENSFPNSKFGGKFKQEDIQHALKTSFFEFLVNRINNGLFPKTNIEMLNYQHRMHPHIGQFISDAFYGGLVKMGERTTENVLPMPSPFDKQVVFLDTSTAENPYETKEGISVKNDVEAQCISQLIVPKLLSAGLTSKDFAIVAPYKSQVANIKEHLASSNNGLHNQIEVSTLDSFQGMEFDVIVFSFTRSKENTKVGFLDDARRLNVAFSRAKKKLILIGNSQTLTDAKSHFDLLYNYTGLFQKLVNLCKNESIGNFVNVTDFTDLKSRFESLGKQLKVNHSYKCKLKFTYEQPDFFGHIFYIENSGLEGMFYDPEKNYEYDSDITYQLYITRIDRKKERISLSPIQSQKTEFIMSNKVGDKVKATFKLSNKFGHIFEISKEVDCFLYDPQKRQSFELGKNYDLVISKIDKSNLRINVSYNTHRSFKNEKAKTNRKNNLSKPDKLLTLKFFNNHRKGEVLNAKYSNSVKNLGHFFELEKGVNGLLFDPDFSEKGLNQNTSYKVEITRMDKNRGQISLKLKK